MQHKYKVSDKLFRELENSVVVPKFQRRLVWSKNEKKAFIETIQNGYPFGSILLYKYDDTKEDKYSIIDGLQRFTTLRDFKNNPHHYIDFSDFEKELYEILIGDNKENKSFSNKIKTVANENIFILGQKCLKEEDPFFLREMVKESAEDLPINQDQSDALVKLQGAMKKHIEEKIKIDDIPIPTITFIGDEDELADVFENLNRGGKKLTKFQVFAAQWHRHEIKLGDTDVEEEILELVVKRYDEMSEKRKIEIEGYDQNSFKKKRSVNLAELCYAIGKLIMKELAIFGYEKEDTAYLFGYTTMAIVLNNDVRKLSTLSNEMDFFNNSELLSQTIKQILNIYREINNLFSEFMKIPGSTKVRYETKTMSENQLLSIFAAFWTNKFEDFDKGYNGVLKRRNLKTDKSNRNRIIENIKVRYLYDVVTNYWSGTGDSKLQQIRENRGQRYISEISQSELDNVLHTWWQERQQSASINFDQISRLIIVMQANLEKRIGFNQAEYEYEHVIARSRLQKHYKANGIAAGSLGNIMILDKSLNNSKKELNLYENKSEGYTINREFIDINFYPTREQFTKIEAELSNPNKGFSFINEIIDLRGKNIINNLSSKLYSI